MQPWSRWREPLAVALLIALGLMLVVRGAAVALAFDAGNTGGLFGGLPGGDALLLPASAAAVLWCATPVPSAHARSIAGAGLVLVGLTVAGWLALTVWSAVTVATTPGPDLGLALLVAEWLLRMAVPAAALVAVVLAVRRISAAAVGDRARPALPSPTPAADDDLPATGEKSDRLPAGWQPEEATGAVWLTADDAAEGRPGLSWSDPGGGAGADPGRWHPISSADPSGQAETAEAAYHDPGQPVARPADEDDDLR